MTLNKARVGSLKHMTVPLDSNAWEGLGCTCTCSWKKEKKEGNEGREEIKESHEKLESSL